MVSDQALSAIFAGLAGLVLLSTRTTCVASWLGATGSSDYPTRDGTAIQYYIHVEDLAGAHLLAMEGTGTAKPGEHRVYNLGNGSGFSVREVVETAREVTGRRIKVAHAPRRAGDPAVLVAASRKIREEIGWAPKKPELEAMISDAWGWIQAYLCGYRAKSSLVMKKAPQRRSRKGA